MPTVPLGVIVLALLPSLSAAESSGVLRLSATAPGAQVYVDGALLGAVPLTKYLPAGSHSLRVVADNFEPYVRTIQIQADKTLDVSASLTAGTGSVEFSGPPGSEVTIGGQSYGLPIRLPSPGTAALDYRAQAPGFEEVTASLPLVKGRNYLVALELESSEGVVAVVTNPAGAAVQLDGKDLGVTPARARGMERALHGVRVSLPGYATVYRTIDTTKGGRGALDVSLTKAGAEVVVNGAGASARVLLNEVDVGEGPQRIANVAKGRLEVTIVEGDRRSTGKFTVPSSGVLTVRLAGDAVVEQKPLTQQWAFWAAVGGGTAAVATTAAVVVAANQPEPAPEGDVVVTLP
jgi:hypothetical protein